MEIDQTKPEETHIGYVRLKSTEKIQNLHFHHDNNDDGIERIDNDQENIGDDDDAEVPIKLNSKHRDSVLILSKQKKRHKKGSLLSVYQNDGSLSTTSNSTSSHSPSNSDYDYAYITALNTRQPLSSIKTPPVDDGPQEPFSATKLPAMCISNVPVPSITNDEYDSAGEENDDDDDIEPTYEIKQYLNSKTFLTYFANLFRDSLANDIGISSKELSNATWKGPIIYSSCWETIPAISCPWPNEAYEWIHRQRDIKENPITQQKFQWPTRVMVNKVVSLGCHVVPLGYVPKYGINPYRELEWKIVFPEAERYLESSLTNTQAKVYIIVRLLIQTYVEPYIDNTQNMFTAEHLRAHLFWQCEMNYAAWPEEYLGEALIRFLNSLLETIKRQRLPDYFLPKRNLFENIPERIMVELHKRIFRITENPVMHLMNALRNLSYSTTFRMAQFNYKKLYSAIVIDNPLKIVNPMFRVQDTADTKKSNNDDSDSDGMQSDLETNGNDALGVIGYFQKVDRTDKSRRRRTKRVPFLEAEKLSQKMEKEKKLEMENEKRREMESMFDVRVSQFNLLSATMFIKLTAICNFILQFSIGKHLEKIRRVIIYELFIDHFIELAASASTFKSYNQALIYLKQASRLCSLLNDDGHPDKAENLLDQIEQQQNTILIERNRESTTRPQLPRRESFLEPSNRGKFRVKLPAQKSDTNDPYKNIREKQKQNEENDEEETIVGGKYRKSQLATSPLAIHRLRRASQRVNVQIHTPPVRMASPKSQRFSGGDRGEKDRNPFFNGEFDKSHPSPRTPETPIRTVTFFSDNESMTSANFNGYSSDLQQNNSQINGYRANRSISNESGDVTTVL